MEHRTDDRALARLRLVDLHMPLVRATAAQVRRQVSRRLETDELVALGTQGLLEAADRFNPRLGVKFASFAYHRVRGAIYDGLRRMGGLSRKAYARARVLEQPAVVALDARALELPFEATAADELAIVRQLCARLRDALSRLPGQERHFIQKHYFEGKTLVDAGAELGLSKSWASRLHARAVRRLRELLEEA